MPYIAGAGVPVKLIVVESPNKVASIQGYLDALAGPNVWRVQASVGHIRDLPMEKGLSLSAVIDTASWRERYVVSRNDVVGRLRSLAASADAVFLATDPDREGEAIAWHLAEELGLKNPTRVAFNEITKTGVQKGIAAPRPLDRHLVEAQRTRRVVDYLIGFELSPRLWPFSLKSAGRVQSAALRILVERERAIQAFKPVDFWTVSAAYAEGFTATVAAFEQPSEEELLEDNADEDARLRPVRFPTKEDAERAVADAKRVEHVVEAVDEKPVSKKPPAPFTTSSLLGTAARVLKWKPERTTAAAQKLFEQGLVTYIRTDSTILADDAVDAIRAHLRKTHPHLVPPKPQTFTQKASAQAAHEAIRPTHIEEAGGRLGGDEAALYQLIRTRTLLCQCASAELSKTTIKIAPGQLRWRLLAAGIVEKFAGFRQLERELRGDEVDDDGAVDDDDDVLPRVERNQHLGLKSLTAKGAKTKPPARFTITTFINYLERKEIGRPSTLAALFKTLSDRGYVDEKRGQLVPEDAGFLCDDLTRLSWGKLTEESYTALCERSFDRVAAGDLERKRFLDVWFADFSKMNAAADAAFAHFKAKNPLLHRDGAVAHDKPCPVCGAQMLRRKGRFGEYARCTVETCEGRLNLSPLDELDDPCPTCSKTVVKQPTKNGAYYRCLSCEWTSSYPPPKLTRFACHVDKSHGKMVKVSFMRDGAKRQFFECPVCHHKASTGVKPPDCPSCKTPGMRLREGTRGAFWSCSKYPECKGTLDAPSKTTTRAKASRGNRNA